MTTNEYTSVLDEASRTIGSLLWQLWNHQGRNSPIGQPIREVLNIAPDAAMTDEQVAAAKRYGKSIARPPAATPTPPAPMEAVPFQARVQPWLMKCFGPMIAGDREERNHRFLEESLELVQSCGCTASEARQLVDYVFGRPIGEHAQEAGGVMVTLAALCLANDLDMHTAGETELARIWTKVEQIRAKQAAKPKHSPLPAAQASDAEDAARYRWLREQQWNTAQVFVVFGGKSHVRLGTDCPSLERLDTIIDRASYRPK